MSSSSSLPFTSFTAFLYFVFFVCANLIVQVQNKSYFGIGTRIIGDQLLLKDILKTPPISLTEEPVIKFQYAIEEPITYLEIESDKSVHAKVNFSYELNLVEGIISSIKNTNYRVDKPEPFEVLIQIYGFNDTILNVNPAYILNKDQVFNGILKPIYPNKIDQPLSLTEEDINVLDYLVYSDEDVDIEEDENKDYDEDEDDFNSAYDKIIEQGKRQQGDFLVYEANQTSATTTELPTNHSVTFYYVDDYYISYIKIIIFEHYLNNSDNTYDVEYSHISPTTLKVIVTDYRTTSLFVQMQMYGFHPFALPVDYKPFLSNGQTPPTTRPISSLTQLKILMNAQKSAIKEKQQQEQEQNNKNGELQQQPTESGHQISPDNESNVNCMQQFFPFVPNSGINTQINFAYWFSFNSFFTFFVITMMFSI